MWLLVLAIWRLHPRDGAVGYPLVAIALTPRRACKVMQNFQIYEAIEIALVVVRDPRRFHAQSLFACSDRDRRSDSGVRRIHRIARPYLHRAMRRE
jgi:hypothetical protein